MVEYHNPTVLDDYFDRKMQDWKERRRLFLIWMEAHLPERVQMDG